MTTTDDPVSTHPLELQILRDLAGAGRGPIELVEEAALGWVGLRRVKRILNGGSGRQELLELADWASRHLNAGLAEPGPWRGQDRKSLEADRKVNAPWLPAAFRSAIAAMQDGPVTLDDLARINRSVGCSGEFRAGPIRVDGFEIPFSAERSRIIAEHHLGLAYSSTESLPLAAARLHLGILLAHPFRDGNGRTARAAAGALLIAGGVRSSVMTCVEQHHHAQPGTYRILLGRLRRGEIDQVSVVDGFLAAMASRCLPAAWVRARCRALLGAAGGVDAAIVYDRGDAGAGAASMPVEPWWRIRPHIHPFVLRELRSQLALVVGETGGPR